ncbi:16S rRNA (cytidine(1402)-2'-O)-methyltransferase [Thiohalorhabdus methylotrophus]|uniref:Ribosomal RNA small subunit methyltransferase I n=1 Tax=Thiohalorhabdus methylotrophus TaxID=3242694 RepID=A0ABV4TV60_9GAMM
MQQFETGILYVVGTPIGNRGDCTPRALETLGSVAAIVAEDTRHVQRLLADTPVRGDRVSLNAHNEEDRIPRLLERLSGGEDLALVSDAGVPAISDPGGRLVAAAHGAGIPVRAVPGPSAVTAALSVAGFAANRFAFEGFLPTKGEARRSRLREIARDPRTVVLFESPRRIAGLLDDLEAACGSEREAVVTRELTKRFETNRRGPLRELAGHFTGHDEEQRGEFTVCVAGAPEEQPGDGSATVEADKVLEALLAELSPSRAAKVAARITGRPKNALYQRAMELDGKE